MENILTIITGIFTILSNILTGNINNLSTHNVDNFTNQVKQQERVVVVGGESSANTHKPNLKPDNILIKKLPIGNKFVISIPKNWTFAPSQMHGGHASETHVFDSGGKLVMRILEVALPVGFEEPEIKFTKRQPVNAQIGKINSFLVQDKKAGSGLLMYQYGYLENGFQITVPFDKKPMPRNTGEYERGEGIPLRYKSFEELQPDISLFDSIVSSTRRK